MLLYTIERVVKKLFPDQKYLNSKMIYLVLIAVLLGCFLIQYSLIVQALVPEDRNTAQHLIYKIPVKGEIDPGLVKLVRKGISEAEKDGADIIVFEIDTYGGLVDSAIKIKDSIFTMKIPSITYVSGRAWSAGALIALAGEKLVMKKGTSIGAAETRPREEKYISALRKEFKATAERRGRNSELAAAMVDSDLVIKGIIDKNKLLTLTAKETIEHNISDLVTKDFKSMLTEFKYIEPEIITVKLSTREKLARFIINPTVSGVLLTVAFIALIFEALAPGWGIGGTIGLFALGLFFSGYITFDFAGWGLIILFLVGIILMAMEIFIIPGFGVTGIGGIIAVLLSLYFTFPAPEVALRVLAVVMILSVVGTIIIIKYFGRSHFWQHISLGESQTKESGYVAHYAQDNLEGKRGEALTPLRPAGIALIENKRFDVVSEGGFIGKGKMIEVVEVSGNRIVVKQILEEDDLN